METYISREVPIPEGDEAKILTQEEIGKLGLPVWELLSTIFRKGVHWIACLEEVYILSNQI